MSDIFFSKFPEWKPAGAVLLFFILLTFIPFPFQSRLNDFEMAVLHLLRGERKASEEIVFVHLSEADIQAMGGWPVTRDYFAYMIDVMTELNAKVIALDILLDMPDTRFPENDRMLAQVISDTVLVVLPSVFLRAVPSDQPPLMYADPFLVPMPELKSKSHSGFSNLGNDALNRSVPIAVSGRDGLVLSFGVQIARLFLDMTAPATVQDGILQMENADGKKKKIRLGLEGHLILNHCGGREAFISIGFLDLLRRFESGTGLPELDGKIAIIAAASPSVSIVHATPLSAGIPASLLHATAAENLIGNLWIRPSALLTRLFLYLFLAGLVFLFLTFKSWRGHAGLIILFFGTLFFSTAVFTLFNSHLPFTCPMLAVGLIIMMSVYLRIKRQKDLTERSMEGIHQQIREKQEILEKAQFELIDAGKRLQKELEEKSQLSEKSRQLAQEKKDAVEKLEKQLRDLERYSQPPDAVKRSYGGIVHAENSPLIALLKTVEHVAADDIPVLLQGETGTGKELFARAIHRSSPRAGKPFIAVNCGALSESLLESELFGHERGAFTGAHTLRKGRFELAGSGTLFLDEITETTPAFQAKLLRVLQDGSFQRVGGEQTLKSRVRVIAAANRDLKKEISLERFRSDLYYRLNGFVFHLPPLRDRQDDIAVLADHFLKTWASKPVAGFSDTAMDMLKNYVWPGNVRELENAVRRAAILAKGQNRALIQAADLPSELLETASSPSLTVTSIEEQILTVMRQLRFCRSAISKTARALGNRDRGTVTEYFRGSCFRALVESDFDINEASRFIAQSADEEAIECVKQKIEHYLDNLRKSLDQSDHDLPSSGRIPPAFTGLPKKYHEDLEKILDWLSE